MSQPTIKQLEKLQDKASELTDKIRTLIDQSMPFKGLKSEDCQKTAIIQQINYLDQHINGIILDDLTPTTA